MRPVLFLMILLLCSLDTFSKSTGGSYPALESAHYGVLLKPLGETGCIKAYQNDKSFSPASVMKLITTATALETLGGDFSYMTKLEYSGEIVDGVLMGDVVIKGAGDPSLGSSYFYDDPYEFLNVWVRELEVHGIDSIAGTVVADASVFDKQVVPDKWIWEDIGNYYGAACYGLSCFDNRYELYFAKTAIGELTMVDSVRPHCDFLSFDNHVLAADNNRDNAYIYGSPWGFEKQIYGSIPAGRELFMIKGALPNPPLVLARLFKDRLESHGISVAKPSHVLWEFNKGHNKAISVWFSPRLSDIVKVTNKKSNNLFAEHLLKSTVISEGLPSTLPLAIDSMMSFWSSCGLKMDGVKVYDGSGLSRASLVTPDFIVGLIDYMSASKSWDVFYESLAVSGVDGTFKYFLDATPLQGKVFGKSGSMSGVCCYAGIIEKNPEEKYSFCIMVNNFTLPVSDVKREIESYLLDLLK